MVQEGGHSDHRWGPRVEDNTMYKHTEEAGKVFQETDIVEKQAGVFSTGGRCFRFQLAWSPLITLSGA